MSEAKRFFIDGEIGAVASVSDGEFHHAVDVLRVRVGDGIVLCNGDGYDYCGRIVSIGKKELTVAIERRERNTREPRVAVTLFQAICKGERMETIVQKCNELGVVRIVPFVSAYTTAKADTHRIERFRKIAAESAKQCRRARVPEISEATDFSEVLKKFSEYDRIIMAYEEADEGSLSEALDRAPSSVALVVGSEGGFSSEEAEAARLHGARIVTMGPRILRAETAAIALTAAAMNCLGEWRR